MVVLILANSAVPDEMQQYAAFHLGLHCFPKYPFRGLQCTKVKVVQFIHVFLSSFRSAPDFHVGHCQLQRLTDIIIYVVYPMH